MDVTGCRYAPSAQFSLSFSPLSALLFFLFLPSSHLPTHPPLSIFSSRESRVEVYISLDCLTSRRVVVWIPFSFDVNPPRLMPSLLPLRCTVGSPTT